MDNASAEDAGLQDISDSIALLRDAGWLSAALDEKAGGRHLGAGGKQAENSVSALVCLGSVNLSVARLFEGHVNALRLIEQHADEVTRYRIAHEVRNGTLLGVWGADKPGHPVVLDERHDGLSGSKCYASGLGVVDLAVVTARGTDGVRLCLVEVNDAACADHSTWRMNGMRATASGTYDFTTCKQEAIRAFGATGCFDTEPHLVGGVWRIAAVQLGGTYGLLEAARVHLASLDRLGDEAQIARLTPIIYRAQAARHLVISAAEFAESNKGLVAPERAVAQSIFARLLTETLAQDAIAAVERSVGLAHFEQDSGPGRVARDLATYLRQIAPDAMLQRAGRETLGCTDPLSELFG